MASKPKPRKASNRKIAPKDECVIPPKIPDSALPNLVFKRDRDAEREIREYVESQAKDEKVVHAEKVGTETILGRKHDAWDVRTDKARWWVITGPTNLYSQELFPSLDYTISFHIGLMARVAARHDPGVEHAEREFQLAVWRRWEQAAEALDEADEAEEFQAVGMRCRECLKAMAKGMARPELVSAGREPPKRGDFVAWSELAAEFFAKGASAEYVRGYLKSVSRSAWQLVNWVTHSENATREDATIAVESTQHVVGVFGRAMFRHARGLPDRCPQCGSYRIGLRREPHEEPSAAVPACQACGWVQEPAPAPRESIH